MPWAPAFGEERRKDYVRAQSHARALRRNETPHEKRLWKLLRVLNKDAGANFRRQVNIGQRVFDFADLGRRLLIELDGGVHDRTEVQASDNAKEIDAILRGYKVIRITNEELRADPGAVVERLRAMITRPSLPPPAPDRLQSGQRSNAEPRSGSVGAGGSEIS